MILNPRTGVWAVRFGRRTYHIGNYELHGITVASLCVLNPEKMPQHEAMLRILETGTAFRREAQDKGNWSQIGGGNSHLEVVLAAREQIKALTAIFYNRTSTGQQKRG